MSKVEEQVIDFLRSRAETGKKKVRRYYGKERFNFHRVDSTFTGRVT